MRNKYALGTDIVEVDRVRDLNQRFGARFLKHVFTEAEVLWCQTHATPDAHFAGRFAAKEAVKKALLTLGESGIPVSTIEILRKDGEPPEVQICSALAQNYSVHISISHTEKYATAVAIVELV